MRYTLFILTAFLSLALASCADDNEKRLAEALEAEQRNDSILKVISSNWQFDVPEPTKKVKERTSDWNEWKQFRAELDQKPTGILTAYQQKTEKLIKEIGDLKTSIPPFFNEPEVRSRIAVLDTKTKSLYTYITLNAVQCDKVIPLIDEIAHETAAIQAQLDELIRISEIPTEIGEAQMLRARDTLRMANPETAPQPSILPPKAVDLKPNTNMPTGNR
ncbi:hypothetical protein [Flavobacterium litorale]|uniref:Uncharacterized protein n=1 Tax=Flavobacterium litorale TaxID=2856519 RepID=A0ABX8VDW2_9FLAO|nr:hypothetical protein [Flavobacterium litorale]QYJ69216.1 hypothetical protein K1I41_04815 [Flavobacterium litorale]